ncbi:hypothetical protein NM688_g6859 [Phlebia brevispora]|uniref:Uncharacterized protein n=1 Tax=Phlebia brevispora TaxID=194682 RepID=A0ACC1SBL2_9APHY|nr:hypothetical protein NM688_g6859 [Phlebia brevispora]
MDRSPTPQEIRSVARKAVEAFSRYNLDCCLFGSAGCALYGVSRTPNDVDLIVVTSSYTTEMLKQLLVSTARATFYLRPAKTPGATYKVLFAKLSPGDFRYRSCKVDILVPGILNIPSVPSHHILRIDGLPVMPLIALLLLKLQGWEDHRTSSRWDMQQKQYVDVRDINQLLQIAVGRGENVRNATWLPQDFITTGQERLNRFLSVLRPASSQSWKTIGFDTDPTYAIF